jgi:hypothetical protein
MLKKTITFKDFFGVDKKRDYYFHLSKAELMEMELGTTGGYVEMIQKIVDAQDSAKLMSVFKEFVLKSYGEISADGERFIKVDDNGHRLADKFVETEAYSILFMELAGDADAFADFVNGIIPADLADKVAEQKPALAPVTD